MGKNDLEKFKFAIEELIILKGDRRLSYSDIKAYYRNLINYSMDEINDAFSNLRDSELKVTYWNIKKIIIEARENAWKMQKEKERGEVDRLLYTRNPTENQEKIREILSILKGTDVVRGEENSLEKKVEKIRELTEKFKNDITGV